MNKLPSKNAGFASRYPKRSCKKLKKQQKRVHLSDENVGGTAGIKLISSQIWDEIFYFFL